MFNPTINSACLPSRVLTQLIKGKKRKRGESCPRGLWTAERIPGLVSGSALRAALLAWGQPCAATPISCLSRHTPGTANAAPACGSREAGTAPVQSSSFDILEGGKVFWLPMPEQGLGLGRAHRDFLRNINISVFFLMENPQIKPPKQSWPG